MALSEAFARMRAKAGMVDVKKLLESAQRAAQAGEDRPWTASNVRVGGVDFCTVHTTGRADTLDFIETMKAAGKLGGKAPARAAPTPASVPATPLLSIEIERHIKTLTKRRIAKDTITESKHSLRVLLGIVGDVPVGEIKRDQIEAFWDAVRWWPANASVKPQYRDLSVREIVAKGRAEGVPSSEDVDFESVIVWPLAMTLTKSLRRIEDLPLSIGARNTWTHSRKNICNTSKILCPTRRA